MSLKSLLHPACAVALALALTGFPVSGESAENNTKTPPAPTKATTPTKEKAKEFELVLVPGGCYQRGAQSDEMNAGREETPAHEVCVDSFYIGKYEVTQAEWRSIMGALPKSEFTGDNLPVQMVSWDDTQKFIALLNKKTGKNYRLPTEAEWEYAARSGSKQDKWSGTSVDKEVGKFAWYGENSQSKPQPVGQKQPNAFGVFDMTGNVWEWVADWYSPQTYATDASQPKKQNPKGPDTGTDHIIRGGAYNSELNGSRTTVRSNEAPYQANTDLGFRLALPAVK